MSTTMTSVVILSLLLAVSPLHAGRSQALTAQFTERRSGVAVGELLFERTTESQVECSAFCRDCPDCVAVSLTVLQPSSSPTCRGYSTPTTMTSTSTLTPGSEVWVLEQDGLGVNCSGNGLCLGFNQECVSGSCLCSAGYYLSVSRDACVPTCPQEDLQHTHLLAYPGWNIPDNNIGNCRFFLSLADCMQVCAQTPEARTCEYNTLMICCMQSVTRLDVDPSSWVQSFFYTHFQKACR